MDKQALYDGKLNQEYIIENIDIPDKNIKRRFFELGILPDKLIKILDKSILKNVLLIEVDGLKLAVRSSFAKDIMVRVKWEIYY